MNKVVVTGGAGFIGSHIVDKLVSDGFSVLVVDNLSTGEKANVNKNATLHVVDIREYEKLQEVISGADYVFHLAAIPSVQDSINLPIETYQVNTVGTLNVLQASRNAGVKKLIYSSSCAVYGNTKVIPTSEDVTMDTTTPYAMQKYTSELLCGLYTKLYSLPTISLRYFNVYGPRQNPKGEYAGVISKFVDLKKNNRTVTITGGGTQEKGARTKLRELGDSCGERAPTNCHNFGTFFPGIYR